MKKSWVLFSKDLTKMSTEFFQEAMPVGKSWKKSRHSGTMKYLVHYCSQSWIPYDYTNINIGEPKGI